MKYLISLILFSLLFIPFQASQAVGSLENATGNLGQAGSRAGTDTTTNLSEIIGNVINVALSLIGLIFLILMVYAGLLWMTARGEDEQVNKSKKIITASIIGLVIVISAYAITYLVTSRFQG